MQYAKSVISAIRPWSLFASALPVLLTISVLRSADELSVLRWDVPLAVIVAVLVQMLANLNAVFSNFHRSFTPLKEAAATDAKEQRITINLLSHTQVRRWSYLFYVMAIACVGLAHVLEHKELRVSIAICLWVSVAFFYCTQSKALPIVGLYELVFALATGPVVMLSATYLLVGKLNWSVCGYSYLVMLVTWAYLIAQSAKDVPFARRMGNESTSLALRLGFQASYQAFLLSLASCYGLLIVLGLLRGDFGNFLLVVSMSKVKDLGEAFRNEQLSNIPDSVARLAAVLGAGLLVSTTIGTFFL